MKRSYMTFIMVAVIGLLFLGCSSPADQASKMFKDGQYQQLIDKFASDPAMSDLVMKSKEMLAENLLKEGKYEELLKTYPDSKVANEAKTKLAEALLEEGKLEEVIAKYPETTTAIKAKLMMEQARGDSLTEVAGDQGKQIKDQKKTIEVAAQREFDRIMKIKNPRLRAKELKSFTENPKFKNTKAAQAAAAKL